MFKNGRFGALVSIVFCLVCIVLANFNLDLLKLSGANASKRRANFFCLATCDFCSLSRLPLPFFALHLFFFLLFKFKSKLKFKLNSKQNSKHNAIFFGAKIYKINSKSKSKCDSIDELAFCWFDFFVRTFCSRSVGFWCKISVFFLHLFGFELDLEFESN